jgi:hypothetical protein
MELKHEAVGYLDDDTIIVEETITNLLGAKSRSFARLIIDTRERVIREGLIKLGWTPPNQRKGPGRRIGDRNPGAEHYVAIIAERRHGVERRKVPPPEPKP